MISRNPVAIQLRYLQTLIEISGNQSATIVFPLPLDVLQPLVAAAESRRAEVTNGEDRERIDEAVQAAQAALKAGSDPAPVSTRAT